MSGNSQGGSIPATNSVAYPTTGMAPAWFTLSEVPKSMNDKLLRILIIEDTLADVVLINSELRKAGLSFRSKRVETKDSFLKEIRNEPPDLILADHGLPSFDSFTALAMAHDECPQVPFIFVTGALGEEMAIETFKSGATDYVLKNQLHNLVPAVQRAIRQAEERTKREQTEQALRISEERFRSLVNGVKHCAIFMLDSQGRVTSWNAGAEWMENYPADEMLGRHISCLYLESDVAEKQPEQALKMAASAGQYEEEGWRSRKGGARFWAKTNFTALRDEARQLRGFAVVMQDFTEQRQHEEVWKRYAAIVNTTKDLLTLIDADFRYVAANDAYGRAHGKAREEIIGRSVPDLWGAEVFQKIIHGHLSRCFEGQEVRYQEWFSFPKLGRRFFEVSYYPYPADGPTTHAIVVTHDITELHTAQETARQLNEALEQRIRERKEEWTAASKEMETLCHSISHDLRAPLRHIDGFIELLQKDLADQLSAQSKSYFKTIAAAARQMGQLIDELLAFSRIGRLELQPRPIHLGEIIQTVREELRDLAAGRKIEWQIQELPPVHADPTLLRHVLTNLISNALKFTAGRATAQIQIGGTATAEENIIFIRDNGVGFDMEYAKKLFGVFQKLHSNQRFEGSGMGLAKARRIIQRHGGRTWAEGTVDGGATFYFSLPILRHG